MMINKSVVCAIIAVYNASFFLARSSFFLYVTERRKVVKMHQIIPQWLTLKVRYQRQMIKIPFTFSFRRFLQRLPLCSFFNKTWETTEQLRESRQLFAALKTPWRFVLTLCCMLYQSPWKWKQAKAHEQRAAAAKFCTKAHALLSSLCRVCHWRHQNFWPHHSQPLVLASSHAWDYFLSWSWSSVVYGLWHILAFQCVPLATKSNFMNVSGEKEASRFQIPRSSGLQIVGISLSNFQDTYKVEAYNFGNLQVSQNLG